MKVKHMIELLRTLNQEAIVATYGQGYDYLPVKEVKAGLAEDSNGILFELKSPEDKVYIKSTIQEVIILEI